MKVELKLFMSLRKNRNSKYQFEIEAESTPLVLASLAQIDPKEVKIVLVNGKVQNMNFTLYENDVVSFFPAVGGG